MTHDVDESRGIHTESALGELPRPVAVLIFLAMGVPVALDTLAVIWPAQAVFVPVAIGALGALDTPAVPGPPCTFLAVVLGAYGATVIT